MTCRVMYLTKHNSFWEQTSTGWSILHGTHHIEELEGNFVNYHHNNQPTIVSSMEDKIVLDEDELFRFCDVMAIPKEAKENFIGYRAYSDNPEEVRSELINSAEAICYVFAELINSQFFSRRILLNNHPNGHPLITSLE